MCALSALSPLSTSTPLSSPTAWRRANRDLVNVAILAALHAKHLAGRGPRVGWYSSIDPGEVVEDDNGAKVLINDVTAVGHIELLRKRTHGAVLAVRVPGRPGKEKRRRWQFSEHGLLLPGDRVGQVGVDGHERFRRILWFV